MTKIREETTIMLKDLGETIPVAARSKAWVCGCWFVGVAVSDPAGVMNVSLL
jgi:hypothetical protein